MFDFEDNRTPLKLGTVLDGKYEIEECIASGGSCLVYSAVYKDESGAEHHVILKENYPFSEQSNIIRAETGELIRRKSNDAAGKAQQDALRLNRFENDPKLASNVVTSVDNFVANNTFYSIVSANMSEGAAVYSNYKKDNRIKDILKTISSLTGVVEKLHEQGYLHLDLKPGNFMVEMHPESDRQKKIILFDVDSLVQVDEEGKVKEAQTITCSEGYRAPEVNPNEIRKIGFSADIYSIGVILFKKIYGRMPAYYDSWPAVRYDFSKCDVFVDEKGNSINPAVKQVLQRILKNTLALLPDFRYQSAEELKKDLDEAIKLCTSPYLETNIGEPLTNFVGRQKELEAIKEHFAKGHGNVLLHGVGGSGKTCIAHKYWEQHKLEYHTGIYLDYARMQYSADEKNPIFGLLSDINLWNYNPAQNEGDPEKNRLKKIAELLNQPGVLILVDNFDMPAHEGQKERYKKIFGTLQNFSKADVIITTRVDLNEMADGETKGSTREIEIAGLPFEQSLGMFSAECGEDIFGQRDEYKKLYDLVSGNTYALFILSRLYKKDKHHYPTIEALAEKLSQGDKLGGRTVYRELNAEEALCQLFVVAGLSKGNQKILYIAYLFRRTDLNEDLVYRIYGDDEGDKILDQLNELVTAGWVTKSGESYFLYPLAKFAVKNKIDRQVKQKTFHELKPFEFYMYFSFKKVSFENYSENQLKSHFEDRDKLEGVVLPKETPLLGNGWDRHTGYPFLCLLDAQREGKLGSQISVDNENPYYESQTNCIFSKQSENSTLYFMSIENSMIPCDKNIVEIGDYACCYNKNDRIIIPQSVERIGYSAFSRCEANEVDIAKSVKEIENRAFEDAQKNITIIFHSIPWIAYDAFADAFADAEPSFIFDGCNGEHINYCLINHENESLVFVGLNRQIEMIDVPKCVKRMENVFGIIKGTKLKIPAGIEYIAPDVIQWVDEVVMDEPGEKYEVIGENLIEKNEDGSGTVVRCWGDLPKDEWINHIGPHAFGHDLMKIRHPKYTRRVRLWEKLLAERGKKTIKELMENNPCCLSEIAVPDNIHTICRDAFDCCGCNIIRLPKTLSYIGEQSSEGEEIIVIEFAGTKAEWDAIPKAEHWLWRHNDVLNFIFQDRECSVQEVVDEMRAKSE